MCLFCYVPDHRERKHRLCKHFPSVSISQVWCVSKHDLLHTWNGISSQCSCTSLCSPWTHPWCAKADFSTPLIHIHQFLHLFGFEHSSSSNVLFSLSQSFEKFLSFLPPLFIIYIFGIIRRIWHYKAISHFIVDYCRVCFNYSQGNWQQGVRILWRERGFLQYFR